MVLHHRRIALACALALAAGTSLSVSSIAHAVEMKIDTAVDAQHHTGGCTLRDAIENVTSRDQSGSTACPGGTGDDVILFEGVSAITLNAALGEIEIGEDVRLQIHGAHVELNGGLATRIFRINGADTKVYMVDMTFRDANAMMGGRGGAIYVDGAKRVELIGTRFEGNVAEDGGALAIDGDGTTLRILEGQFSGNRATGDENGDLGFGGALDIRGIVDALIVNSDFSFNEARSGGAVSCESSNEKTSVAFSGGVNGKDLGSFEGNTAWAPNADIYAPYGGGAIFSRCPIDVSHQRFIRNVALGKGGAIYHSGTGQKARIATSVFRENKFLEAGGLEGNALGGAIAVETGGMEIMASSFTANVAARGGALYVRDTNEDEITVMSSTLSKNVAQDSGAAMYFNGSVNVGAVWNVTMRGNGGGDSFHFETPDPGSEVDLANTIIESASGTANCGGDLSTVFVGDANLQVGNPANDTCSLVAPVPFGDPKFGGVAQASFYPYTSYFPIGSNGDAANRGDPSICKFIGYDQIFQTRDVLACSIGAVEPY